MVWRIGVADTGVELGAGSGAARIVQWKGFVRGASLTDSHGHGRACWAAFEAALALHGVSGPPIEVVYATIFTAEQPRCSAAELAAAITWMAERGARVIALPCGTAEPDEPLWHAVRAALSSGAVVVAAAGTDPLDPLFPAAYEGVVAVHADATFADSSRAVMFAAARILAAGAAGSGAQTRART